MNVITTTKELGEASKDGMTSILVSPDIEVIINVIRQPICGILLMPVLSVLGAFIAAIGFVLTMVGGYGLMLIGLFAMNGEAFPGLSIFCFFCKSGAVILPVGTLAYLLLMVMRVCIYGGGFSALARIREMDVVEKVASLKLN